MKIISQRFGEMEVQDDKIITFPEGIIGFPELKRFVIHQYQEEKALGWLQSVDEPDLAFVIINPNSFMLEYRVELQPQDVAKLGLSEESEAITLAIAVIPDLITNMTANIVAPIVINIDKMIGRQVILNEPRYSVRHRVFDKVDTNRVQEKAVQGREQVAL